MRVQLANETDLAGFRHEARALLAARVRPAQVEWSVAGGQDDLFAAEPVLVAAEPAAAIRVPPAFVELCRHVLLHREPQRFALLYRLLWRLVHEPALRHDPLDPDMLHARELAQAVRRDIHKMHAFVRFRPVAEDGEEGKAPLHVAWYEPAHYVVEATAPWFQRRFANMRWAILTPDTCVEWDGGTLQVGPGAARDAAPPPDAGEQLWLTYYRSIFNPARLKLAAMQKEMPRRYWRNLPETQLIAPLAAAARERSGRMIEQPATLPSRRIPIGQVEAPSAPAGGLPGLLQAMQQCRTCPIGAHATQAVAGEGPLAPQLMFVGEQPGDQEDLRGQPFVGPAGQLLDRAFAEAGIARHDVYLTNAVRHFKYELRGKRRIHKTPTQHEALACRHWLDEEIALVRPRALVALGATAARSLLGRSVAVLSERGVWHARVDGLQVLVTLHPSALLRLPVPQQPRAFEEFVADLRRAARPAA